MSDPDDFQLRIRLGEVMLGPGKADLLDGIRQTGSISAAGRRMSMSYRRAWQLVEQLNLYFGAPVVATLTGGRGGGGAELTALGEDILSTYRRMQQDSAATIADDLAHLRALRK